MLPYPAINAAQAQSGGTKPHKKEILSMTSRKFGAFSQWSLFAAILLVHTFPAHTQDLSNVSLASTTAPVIFNFESTPDVGSIGSLSANRETNIWATSVTNSVSLHFNGTSWVRVPMAKASRVNKVAVLSSTNVWAVGQQTNDKFSQVQHFNGTVWSVVSSPHFTNGESLNSLKAISASNIFAVGNFLDSLKNRTPLVEHFDGTKWSVVPVPHITGGELTDIAVLSPSDIWAVGEVSGATPAALTIHFNGLQWSRVPAPPAALLAVTSLATNNVWAPGVQLGRSTVIEHWDGTSWKVVSSPNTGTASVLNSISAISPTDIWAAGCNACGDVGGSVPALIEHWNGTAWSVNPAPVQFSGVSANTVLAFPLTKHIFVGGFTFASFGPSSVIMKGAE
jgi:hypothetical protein